MATQTDWQERCRVRKQKQIDSIPKEWVIEAVPESQLNVMNIPKICGLLSTLELDITEATFEDLLNNLASGHWSCVQVTTAFYKRAIVAQQLVSFSSFNCV
jgi:amidase